MSDNPVLRAQGRTYHAPFQKRTTVRFSFDDRSIRMRFLKTRLAVLGAAVIVAACGGGGAGDQAPRVPFTALVSFGDSLSDVGNEKVGTIAAIGGGKWTV